MTAAVHQVDHVAERPGWNCRRCGEPWPCGAARERLSSDMDRVDLAIYMWARLDDAVGDLPGGPPEELFERFIRWTH